MEALMVGPIGPLLLKALGLPWASLAKGSSHSCSSLYTMRHEGHTYLDACHNITQMHLALLFLFLSSAMHGD